VLLNGSGATGITRSSGSRSASKGKRGQAYNLNLAGSDILAPDGRGNWHISPKCSSSPNSNRACWDRKRETNMARDRHVTRQLRGRGCKVIRVWQHCLQKSPAACLNRIRHALTTYRGTDLRLGIPRQLTIRQLAKRRIALVLRPRTRCLDPYLPERPVWVMVHP